MSREIRSGTLRVARAGRRLATLCLLAAGAAQAAQIPVDSAADDVLVDGKVTLREALLSFASKQDYDADVGAVRASAYGDADSIQFAIAADAQTISAVAPLPAVASGLHIDGATQPGYAGQNLITLDGAQAGATTDGLVLLEGSTLTALDVVNFGGSGLRSDDDILFAFGFDSDSVTDPVLGAGFVAITVDKCGSFDNGGDGLRADAGTAVSANGLSVLRNRGVGLRARGALAATQLVADFNAGDGVLVDSADPVELDQPDIRHSGQHPQLPATQRSGLRVLRASRPDELDGSGLPVTLGGLLVHGSGTIASHTGDGIVVGDVAQQTGAIQAAISDLQIHDNLAGIRVAQRDSDAYRTAIRILANNIYQNSAAGMYLGTSYMYPAYTSDRRVISGNNVHHNAVTPPDQCSAATATQSAAQVIFDGAVAATAEQQAACQPPGVDTLAECNALSNPTGPLSNGVNNHCVWTGVACTVAWDAGGTEQAADCDSSRNRVFAYVNDQIQDPSTQKGISAFNGAIVRARRNVWGVGGPVSGIFQDVLSRIDADNDCGSISTCP